MKTAIIFYHISLSSSYNEKFFKDAQKIKIHILCLIVFFFKKIVPFLRKCGKIN